VSRRRARPAARLALRLAPAALAAPLVAQPPPRYEAAALACAVFDEAMSSRSKVTLQGREATAVVERAGVLVVRGTPHPRGVAIEAWWDSLAVRRRTLDTDAVPDTDGLLGGRYHGVLSPDGAWTDSVRPFVPDDVADVVDMADVLATLFPPLPPRALARGERARAEAGEFARLADGEVAGLRVARWELAATRPARLLLGGRDSLPGAGSGEEAERTTIAWAPAAGLVERVRELVLRSSAQLGDDSTAVATARVTRLDRLRRRAGARCP